MALTSRFGLTHFDAATEGSLSRDGGKFTGRDRRVIDRILAAFETHRHDGGDRLEDPDFEPTLTLHPTGGTLPAGRTFFYRVSYVDAFALETAAGEESSIATPGSITPPSSPRAEAQPGGDLDEGLYWYALTAHDTQGNETPMSAPQVLQVTDWRQVEVSAPNGFALGTAEVSVWRQGPFDSGFTRLDTYTVIDPNVAMVPIMVDDGSIPSSPTPTPNQNLTGGSNAVEIEIPPLPEGAVRWRIYRSEVSGNYPSFSLVAEVHETEEEGGGDVVTTFLDVGEEGHVGKPLESSQTLAGSRKLFTSEDGGFRFGDEAETDSYGAVVLGHYAVALGEDAIAIGHLADAGGDGAIALGHLTKALGRMAIAIGDGVEVEDDYEARIGDERHVVRVGGLARHLIETTEDLDAWSFPEPDPDPQVPDPEPERASIVLVDAAAGNRVVDLGTMILNGAEVTVKKIDSSANTVIVDPGEGRAIDGGSNKVLGALNEFVRVVYSSASDTFYEV